MAEIRQFGRIILAAHHGAHLCPIYHIDFKIRPGRNPKIGFASWLLDEQFRSMGCFPGAGTRSCSQDDRSLERYAMFCPAQGRRQHWPDLLS
jgi:hypothetical protein